MVKRILTNQAVQKIIALKNDNTENHTFSEIAGIIEREFGQKVSFQTIAKAYHKHKDTMVVEVTQVKPKSKLAELVEQRKAEKSASQTTSQPAPKPIQKPYRPSNSLLDENGEEPEWMKIANMSVPEFKEYKAKKAAEKAAKKAEEEKQAQVATSPAPTHTPNQSHLPPSKRVYQAPDMEKLTRMLHMSDDEFREMMRQEAEEEAKNTQTQK